MMCSKPSGIRAGRKLRIHRRNERWSSKKYNKSHSVSHMKANPLGGSCMSKGIVLEKMSVTLLLHHINFK
jgi:small subunit ribosomal protein S23e